MPVVSLDKFMSVLPDGGKKIPPEAKTSIEGYYNKYVLWQEELDKAWYFHNHNLSGIDNSTDIDKNVKRVETAKEDLIREITSVKMNYYSENVEQQLDNDENDKLAM